MGASRQSPSTCNPQLASSITQLAPRLSPLSQTVTRTMTESYIRNGARKHKILCLDGGGVRGLSALMILRRIMYNIKPNSDNYALPKPCEYFDVVCGTSTGGLIAIMLGRLGMGVQECIDVYCDLSSKIFAQKIYEIGCFGHISPIFGIPRFSYHALEEEVQKMVSDRLGKKDAELFEVGDPPCKVFVTTVRSANSEPTLLRSYLNSKVESTSCTIWEAARATSAAPTFFAPITFGTPLAEYVDGGIRINNPIEYAEREAKILWGHGAKFSCIVSIGTGLQRKPRLGKSGYSILRACAKMATETERTAKSFRLQHRNLVNQKKYFRFNVISGLEAVPLAEWRAADQIDACTSSYLEDVQDDIDKCVAALKRPTSSDSHSDSKYPQYEDVSKAKSLYFTDREDVLVWLTDLFWSLGRNRQEKIAVLHGMGAIGKTQIALEYISRHRQDYCGIFFIDSSSEQQLYAAFWRIAHLVVTEELRRSSREMRFEEMTTRLGFSGLLQDTTIQVAVEQYEQIVGAVKRWLRRVKDRVFLLVFDGADCPSGDHIRHFIPYDACVDVLITTRDSDAANLGEDKHIDPMGTEDAVDLLSHASKLSLKTGPHKMEAEKIVKKLGGFPLAIDQAGCYLGGSDPNITRFLNTYDARAKEILSRWEDRGLTEYPKSALTTWEINYNWMLTKFPVAAALLGLLAFVYPNDICSPLYNPTEEARGVHEEGLRRQRIATTIEQGFSNLNRYWVLSRDPSTFRESFSVLLRFSLVNCGGEKGTYVFHPVVHLWAKERLSPAEQKIYARDAVLLVARALPDLSGINRTSAWQIHRRLLPHIHECCKNLSKYLPVQEQSNDRALLRALHIIARSYRRQGYLQQAEELFVHVLKCRRRYLSKDSMDLLESIEDLAAAYDQRGKLVAAESLYLEALAGREATSGKSNLVTLKIVNELAGVYDYMGEVAKAEKLYRRALEGLECKGGALDADVLCVVEDLAGLLDHAGRVDEAETLRKRAFHGRKMVLGPNHPDTLTSALNLGGFYWQAGELTNAQDMFEKACKGREEFFGKQHPQTLFALNHLAGLLFNLGLVDQSEKLYRQVLADREIVLGPDDPDTLWTKSGLGGVLLNTGKIEEAEQLLRSAKEGLESGLGKAHPDTLWVVHNLAIVYEAENRLEEAEQLHLRAMKGYEHKLGLKNRDTLWILTDLAECYHREDKLDAAQNALKQAYEEKKALLGESNPETMYTGNCLAGVLWGLGKVAEAEDLYQKILEGRRKVQGPVHPDTTWTLQDLGCLYMSQRRWADAEKLLKECVAARKSTMGEKHPETLDAERELECLEKERRSTGLSEGIGCLKKTKTLAHSYGFGCRRRRDQRRWT